MEKRLVFRHQNTGHKVVQVKVNELNTFIADKITVKRNKPASLATGMLKNQLQVVSGRMFHSFKASKPI